MFSGSAVLEKKEMVDQGKVKELVDTIVGDWSGHGMCGKFQATTHQPGLCNQTKIGG